MKRLRPVVLGCVALGVVLASGCGLFKGTSSSSSSSARAERASTRAAKRAKPAPRGARLATIPTEARPSTELLSEGLLVGIRDGVSDLLDDPAALPGEVAWLGHRLTRMREDDAKTLVVVRRAAFGVHVPSAGERAVIDDEVLHDRDLGVSFDVVALIGPEAPCFTVRHPPVVTSMEVGGHVLDVRWPLTDCGAGPWAPMGLVAAGISKSLHWDPPQCEETDEIQAAWASAGDPATPHLGVLREGEAIVGLIGQGELWIPTPRGWESRIFPMGSAVARGCTGAEAETPAPEPSDDDASDELDDPDARDEL